MAQDLLTVWAAGTLPDAVAPGASGVLRRYAIRYGKDGFEVADDAGNAISPSKEGAGRYATTLIGVGFVTFHAQEGVPDLALRCLPDIPPGECLGEARLPFEADDTAIAAYARLARICAAGFSVVRLTGTGPTDRADQWLNFRLTLLDRRLIEPSGSPHVLTADEIIGDAMAGVQSGGTHAFVGLRQAGATAELRDVLGRRAPYFAGGFRKADDGPIFESFALNATAMQVIGATLPDLGNVTPSHKERWGQVAGRKAGFWWASHPDPAHETAPLTLEDALRDLGKFPPKPKAQDGIPILTRLEPAGETIAAQLALLDLLDLRAEAAAPRDTWPPVPGSAPYHHLHMRQDGAQTTWQRWLALAGDPTGAGPPTPALLEVVRKAGTPEADGALTIRLKGLTDRHFLHLWARRVGRPLRERARQAPETGRLTLVPEFDATTSKADEDLGGHWEAELECREPWPSVLRPGAHEPTLFPGRYRLDKVVLRRSDKRLLAAAGEKLGPLRATALRLPDLHAQAAGVPRGLALTGAFDIDLGGTDALVFTIGADLEWRLETAHSFGLSGKVAVEAGTEEGARLVAIGGLDIRLDAGAVAPLAFDVRMGEGGLDYEILAAQPLLLPVKAVEVRGSDIDEDDPAMEPLLWGDAFMGAGRLACVDYRSAETGKRVVGFDLQSDAQHGQSVGEAHVTIVDPAPMMVVKVTAERLAAPSASRQSAASYQAAEGLWRLTPAGDKRQEVRLTLPPQGVAEAWERSAPNLPKDQVKEGERVPARLTPATELRIEGDERARNQIAPWNLRHILGFSDADLPGARLLSIDRLEALYGLEAWTGELGGLRLAEMAGWRGIPREAVAGDPGRLTTWRAALSAWRRRLGVLDLRDERDWLARPRIEGVRFRLRTRLARTESHYPIDGDEARYLKPVDGSGVPEKEWASEAEGGILGGALAGFEQPSLVASLVGRRDGVGEIDGAQFSALGAWTKPRAAFHHGLTLIASDVAMGRVSEARFERKGRIGALHHLAKHVIVYRRTFLPSRQFAKDQEGSWNLGRPIVRKVEEYVEISEPLRSYPDRAGAGGAASGPVLGARFRTVRIPVHGAWAAPLPDPGVEGYSIPLWRPEEDPAVYPQPVVDLLFAGDPARSEPEPLARRIETPERLRFYTLTAVGGAEPSGEVETWPLVHGLDYLDRATDSSLHGKITLDRFQVPGQPGAMLPPDAAEAPGLEKLTLHLEPGPGVNVLHGRARNPAIADLRSVLMMRGTPPAAKAPDPRLGAVSSAAALADRLAKVARAPASKDDLRTEAAALLTQLRDLAPGLPKAESPCDWAHVPSRRIHEAIVFLDGIGDLPTLWSRSRAEADAALAKLQAQVDALLPLGETSGRLLQPLLEQSMDFEAGVGAVLKEQFEGIRTAIEAAVQGWEDALGGVVDQLDRLVIEVDDAKADPETVLAKVRGELADTAREARGALAALAGHLSRLDEAAAQLRKAAPKLEKAAPKASGLALTLAIQLEAARARLSDLHARSEKAVPEALATVLSAADSWARAAIGSAPSVVRDALSNAKAVVDAIRLERGASVDVLTQLLTTALGSLVNEVSTSVKQLEALLPTLTEAPLDDADQWLRELSSVIARLRELAADAALPADLVRSFDQARGKVGAALKAILDLLDGAADKICTFTKDVEELASKLLEGWQAKLDELAETVSDFTGETDALRVKLDTYAGSIGNAVGALRRGIEQVLDQETYAALNQQVQPEGFGQAVALSLLRAAGAPPIVEQLAFNRERIAYHFESQARVIVTPVTALVDQAEQALRGVGIALPTLGLGETLLAPAHEALKDLSGVVGDLELKAKDVLKDFAGLKDLLPSLDFGPELARAVRVTHDYDAKRNIAWLQAEVNYGPETQDLFRHEAFAVVAERMTLRGLSRYERGLAGGESRSVKAGIVSDWVLILGGMPLVRIRDAAIRYDEKSGFAFDIRPDKIEFPGALQLLTEALSSFAGGGDSPLAIELLNDPLSGRPIGLKSRYDLPPTSFGAGAVAVMNAALGVHLELAQRAEFEIRAFAYFGRNDSPFAMTVSLLGGGGYVEAEATHLPASRRTDIAVRVSLGLVAGTGFNFGPLRGSIQVYLGFEASFASGSSGSRISVTALFVLSGSVTAWGFVTVSLGVRLALTYAGRDVVGHGTVKVEVRISRFYKKRFSRAITYRL